MVVVEVVVVVIVVVVVVVVVVVLRQGGLNFGFSSLENPKFEPPSDYPTEVF